MNSMLICRTFCWLLTVGHLLHRKFCWFCLFLLDFHFFDYQGHLKSSPQKVRDKGGLWKGRSDPSRSTRHAHLENYLHWRKTRLTCKSDVSFRSRFEFWLQWPIRCIQLWSQFLLVWIWITWKSILHRMSASNGWVLSLNIQFLLSIRVSRTRTRLSSHFYPAFRLLKRRKMSE